MHPQTGEFLRPRPSADRVAEDGSGQSKGRSLYDRTFSEPKSISIQALGGDERLVAAHDGLQRETLQEAESHIATRVRLSGANADRLTVNWAVATYRHDTIRELDPHRIPMPLQPTGPMKKSRPGGKLFRHLVCMNGDAYMTEVYRKTLAGEVFRLGYEIEPRNDSRGDLGFEIDGVLNELIGK